jgi:uncharacterized protein (DUF2164 family)
MQMTTAETTETQSNISLTDLEAKILLACLNYDNIEEQLGDNYSNCDLKDAHKICGGKHQSAGVIGSLCKKGLVGDPMDEENNIIYPTEEGLRAIFSHKAKS